MKFYIRNFISYQIANIIIYAIALFVCYKIIIWLIKNYKAEKAAYGKEAALKTHGVYVAASIGVAITILIIFINGTITQLYGYYEIKNNQIKIWYVNPLKSTQYVKISDIKKIELYTPNSGEGYKYIITKKNEKIFMAYWLKNNNDDDLYSYINRNYNIPYTVKHTNN